MTFVASLTHDGDPASAEAGASPTLAGDGIHSVFVRQGQRFGIAVEFVREVINGRALTRIPQADAVVAGVLNLRGDMLPVVLVDPWLELPGQQYDPAKPILVLRQGDVLVGVQVDSMLRVTTIPSADLAPAASVQPDSCLTHLWRGVDENLVTLLDGRAMLRRIGARVAPHQAGR